MSLPGQSSVGRPNRGRDASRTATKTEAAASSSRSMTVFAMVAADEALRVANARIAQLQLEAANQGARRSRHTLAGAVRPGSRRSDRPRIDRRRRARAAPARRLSLPQLTRLSAPQDRRIRVRMPAYIDTPNTTDVCRRATATNVHGRVRRACAPRGVAVSCRPFNQTFV
jgi:hypothetical protein